MPRLLPDQPPLRTVNSFVIRAGRMTDAQQAARDRLWSRYGLEVDGGRLETDAVFGRRAPLVFEIGFGMGGSLAEMARAQPDHDFIGVEVHPPGIGTLLRLIEQQQLDNLRVYQADTKVVLERCIGEGQLHRVQIFFPDPWPKKRHHKRRLIQPEFIDALLPKLEVGGVLHLATDWEPYAQYMLEVLGNEPRLANMASAGCFMTGHGRPLTKFEQRGQRLGHGVWDLQFVRLATADGRDR